MKIFYNNFIEIQLTYYTIHPFKIHHSMVLVYLQGCETVITVSISTFSSSQREAPYPVAVNLQSSPSPKP